MRHILILGVVLIMTPAVCLADWTGKGEAGLVIANGNTDTENANAKLESILTAGKWKHAFGAAGIYASDDEGATGQRWEVYEQTDYNFSDRTFWFGAGRYEQDRFSGFEYQIIASSGLGRHFIDNDATKLIGTAGFGYKFFETRDEIDATTGALIAEGDTGNEVVFRSTLDYDHALTDTTRLLDKFLVEAGADNTFIQNDIGIQVKITTVLALAVAYSIRHNTDPPPGFDKTDTLTTVNLVYEFK